MGPHDMNPKRTKKKQSIQVRPIIGLDMREKCE